MATVETQQADLVPLTSIQFSAQVAGLQAQVTCRQQFRNAAPQPIEAVYTFPLPAEASVVACRLQIGDKRIEAELKERQQAKREYDEALAAGHTASLLEQERSNVFTMSVGGIAPGEAVEAVITYHQRVPWQAGGGRFVIPLVVAPRFIPGQGVAQTGTGWAPDTDRVPDASRITPVVAKEGVPCTATIAVMLQAGFPCEVSSPSHNLPAETPQELTAAQLGEFALTELRCDRDFVLCYRTTTPTVTPAVHRGEFNGEHFATVTLVPPNKATAQPKDVVLCLDMSGSMEGAKIAGLRVVAEKVVRGLTDQGLDNRVAVLAFDNETSVLQPLEAIGEQTLAAIRSLVAQGGTRAGKALNQSFALLAGADGTSEKYVLLLSDGQTEDRWSSVTPGVRVVAAGIDTAVNANWLEDIARASGGVAIGIYPGEDYDTAARLLVGLLSGPVLHEVRLTTPDGHDVPDLVGVRDVFEGMPVTLALRASPLPATVTLTGRDAAGTVQSFPLTLSAAPQAPFTHALWAREKLRGDLAPDEQVSLSLRHGVLCPRTAFVAVCVQSVLGQAPQRVPVPVNLPHTWDYASVFGFVEADCLLMEFTGAEEIDEVVADESALDEIEAFLDDFKQEGGDVTVLASRWQLLVERLQRSVNSYDEVATARCLALCLQAQVLGLLVPADLLAKVDKEPDTANYAARQWWAEAQQWRGVQPS